MSSNRYELSLSKLDDIKPFLLYLTQSEFGNDWHSTPHCHQFLEILFVYDGQGTFIINSQKCALVRGDFVIIKPNTIHTEKSSSNSPMKYYILGIDNMSVDVRRVDKSNELEKADFFPVYHYIEYYDKSIEFMTLIMKEMQQKKMYYETMVQSLLAHFLIPLLRHTNLEVTELENTSSASKESTFVKQYIDSYFASNINIDELANKTFITKYHLIHSFTKAYSISPMQYLIQRRMREAKALLRTTDLDITEISNNLNFSSPSHFAQKFKELEKLTPKQYRLSTKALQSNLGNRLNNK